MCEEKGKECKECIDLLKFFANDQSRYHDHKETMAWVATAFYLGGIMYLAFNLRPYVIACVCWRVLAGLLFAFLGLLVFRFIQWQFNIGKLIGKVIDMRKY